MAADPDVVERLFRACKKNDAASVEAVLKDGMDPSVADKDGVSPLMYAADNGNENIVHILLQAGASWQAQDKDGYTAGEYAMGHPDKSAFRLLMEWAVQSEMLMGRESLRKKQSDKNAIVNDEYLKSTIRYSEDGEKLLDDNGEAVMMGWEAPLMVHHAEAICWKRGQGSVLNIGFGMGIIDSEIQKLCPQNHTIIEAHPDVYKHMCRTGWCDKEKVNVVFGRWQDVIDKVRDLEIINAILPGYCSRMCECLYRLPAAPKPAVRTI